MAVMVMGLQNIQLVAVAVPAVRVVMETLQRPLRLLRVMVATVQLQLFQGRLLLMPVVAGDQEPRKGPYEEKVELVVAVTAGTLQTVLP